MPLVVVIVVKVVVVVLVELVVAEVVVVVVVVVYGLVLWHNVNILSSNWKLAALSTSDIMDLYACVCNHYHTCNLTTLTDYDYGTNKDVLG